MKRWVNHSVAGMALATGLAFATIACGGGYVSYYAPNAPPPPQAEYYGTSPGAGYVWIGGYWGWQGGRYAWVPGRWDRPPRGYNRWEAGRWENHGGQYRWHEGHWRR